MSSRHTFLPWLRTGLANQIAELDQSGANHLRASVQVRVHVAADELEPDGSVSHSSSSVSKAVHLIGPGEILGIHDDAISLISPAHQSRAALVPDLPFVEFVDADFPWRYTPARPSGERLTPWLALLVLVDTEFSERPAGGALLQIQIRVALDLDPGQLWAWAHVDLEGEVGPGGIEAEVLAAQQHAPERLHARLLCPRRLEPFTRYHMFLVPSFERGRKIGIGEDPSTTPALAPAWTRGQSGVILPVYQRWSFDTAVAEDFEGLARKLRAMPLSPQPPTAIALDRLEAQLGLAPSGATAGLRSALVAPGTTHTGFSNASIRQHLAVELDAASTPAAGGDPYALVPPIYGRWAAAQTQVDPQAGGRWLEQLNLDPGLRALAGIGATIVETHQEQFVDAAWDQYGELERANEFLRHASLSAEVGERVHRKHLSGRSAEGKLALSSKALGAIELTPSTNLATAVDHSRLPSASLGPAMAKLVRSGRRHRRLLEARSSIDSLRQQTLITRLAATTSAAPTINPGDTNPANTAAVQAALPSGATELQQLVALTVATGAQDGIRATREATPAFVDAAPAAVAITRALHPHDTIAHQVGERLTISNATSVSAPLSSSGQVDTILAAPSIDVPVVRYLLERDPDLVVPHIHEMHDDSVSLLVPDPMFIEAVLAGMNHAMAAELLWRRYPTDQRGTCFRMFWDRAPGTGVRHDITQMHTWAPNSSLGTHDADPQTGMMVLAIKSRLLERHGDLDIFVQRAAFVGSAGLNHPRTLANPAIAGNVLQPLFRASVGAGVVVIGFALGAAAARGSAMDPGWFVLLREQVGRVRFGLDTDPPPAPSSDPNDFSWVDLGPDSATFIHLPAAPHERVFTPSLVWGASSNAADIASILCQMPLLLGVHASDLVP